MGCSTVAVCFIFLLSPLPLPLPLPHCWKVRVENIKHPTEHIPSLLDRVKEDYIRRTYQVTSWADPTDLLEKVAQRTGRLLKVLAALCSFALACLHGMLMVFFLAMLDGV